MPLPRILQLVYVAGAALAVTCTLVDLDGTVLWSGTLALLAAAAYVALLIRRPVARWSLTAGLLLLAAVSFTRSHATPRLAAGPAASSTEYGRYFDQLAVRDFTEAVLLLLATVTLLVGVVTLPQFLRPAWLTAVACGVALIPVAVATWDAAENRQLLLAVRWDTTGLLVHLVPGLTATVLAGLALVLAVSRAERWFLAPAGAFLVQLTAMSLTRGMSGAWYSRTIFGPPETGTFLSPGYAWTTTPSLEFEAALMVAAFLLGPALLAAGATRTAAAATPTDHA